MRLFQYNRSINLEFMTISNVIYIVKELNNLVKIKIIYTLIVMITFTVLITW